MNEIIKETKDYELFISTSLSNSKHLCYQIYNKITDVVEIETTLLPQALKQLPELQAALDSIRSPGLFTA
jgi:hypothetical protein